MNEQSKRVSGAPVPISTAPFRELQPSIWQSCITNIVAAVMEKTMGADRGAAQRRGVAHVGPDIGVEAAGEVAVAHVDIAGDIADAACRNSRTRN